MILSCQAGRTALKASSRKPSQLLTSISTRSISLCMPRSNVPTHSIAQQAQLSARRQLGPIAPSQQLSAFRPVLSNLSSSIQTRSVHGTRRLKVRPVPPPTPFVPNVETFLKLIGRGMSAHASKIPSWEALFQLTSQQLATAGIEPARKRRYLLWWRERFRQGIYGVGGDLKYVNPEGVAELRVYEQPFSQEWIDLAEAKRVRQVSELNYSLEILKRARENNMGKPDLAREAEIENRIASLKENPATILHTPNSRLIVVNVPPGTANSEICPIPIEGLNSPNFIKVANAQSVKGPFVMPAKGTNGAGATLTIQEGMWEEKRGRKIDGGERRRAEVQAKRRIAENKNK